MLATIGGLWSAVYPLVFVGTNRANYENSLAGLDAGTPFDKLNSIFETFYTTKEHGTGLGLSIARTIVETYGGR